MKKMIIKNRENENEVQEMIVVDCWNFGTYYEIELEDGWGSLPSERVIRVEEIK